MNFFPPLGEFHAPKKRKGPLGYRCIYSSFISIFLIYLSLSRENTQVIRVASQGWHRRLNKLTAPPAEEMSCIFFFFFFSPLLLPHSISTDISIGTRGKNSAGSRPKVLLNVAKKTQGNKSNKNPHFTRLRFLIEIIDWSAAAVSQHVAHRRNFQCAKLNEMELIAKSY